MRRMRHPSPLPPDPAAVIGSPLPTKQVAIVDGSPLPPDPRILLAGGPSPLAGTAPDLQAPVSSRQG
jgi:hypothetical protein